MRKTSSVESTVFVAAPAHGLAEGAGRLRRTIFGSKTKPRSGLNQPGRGRRERGLPGLPLPCCHCSSTVVPGRAVLEDVDEQRPVSMLLVEDELRFRPGQRSGLIELLAELLERLGVGRQDGRLGDHVAAAEAGRRRRAARDHLRTRLSTR